MLRLVHQTTVFGPLYFEYDKPLVRVGSCRDNDLILQDPSVQPYHCVLHLEEEVLRVLAPDAVSAAGEIGDESQAPCYGPGDTLELGGLKFEVELSPNSFAIPKTPPEVPPAAEGLTHDGYWRADFPQIPDEAKWLCQRCQIRLTSAQVHVLGLVAHRKYALCPKCSQKVDLLAVDDSNQGLLGRVRKRWRRFKRNVVRTFQG